MDHTCCSKTTIAYLPGACIALPKQNPSMNDLFLI
jgi:hypothetical protein